VYSVLTICPINSLPNKLAPYIFLTIHLNIICIAITGNKILCLMSYVLPWHWKESRDRHQKRLKSTALTRKKQPAKKTTFPTWGWHCSQWWEGWPRAPATVCHLNLNIKICFLTGIECGAEVIRIIARKCFKNIIWKQCKFAVLK
jgi:hypothetical protein